MILKYGAYTHANNEVAYTITRHALKTQGGIFYAYEEQWSCTGILHSPDGTQNGLTNAIIALTNAYSVDGYDLVHYLDDGVTPTAHQLISVACNGGTRVLQAPQFPIGTGGEYTTYRNYSFTIAGEVPLTSSNVLTKYEEKISVKGTGGPVQVWIPVAEGPWIRQQTSTASTFQIQQTGHATGLYAYPPFNDPIWPDAEIVQQRQQEQGNAEARNGRFYNFPASWSYTFESSGQLVGQPNGYPQ